MTRWRGRLSLLVLVLVGLLASAPARAKPAGAGGGLPDPGRALLTLADLDELSAGWETLVDDCGAGACRRGPLRCRFDVSNLCVYDPSAGSGASACPSRAGLPDPEPVASAQALWRQPAWGVVLVHVVAVFTPGEAARELACIRALLDAPGGTVTSAGVTIRFTPLPVAALGEETIAVRVAVEQASGPDAVGPCVIVASRQGEAVITLELCGRDADPRAVSAALTEQLAHRAAARWARLAAAAK